LVGTIKSNYVKKNELAKTLITIRLLAKVGKRIRGKGMEFSLPL
jgi:hypothetical protein